MAAKNRIVMGVLFLVYFVAANIPFLMHSPPVSAATVSSQAEVNEFVKTLKFKDAGTITGTLNGETITFRYQQSGLNSFAYYSNDLVCGSDRAMIASRQDGLYLSVKVNAGGCNQSAVTVKTNLNANSPAAKSLASRLNEETLILARDIFATGFKGNEKFIRNGTSNFYLRDSESGDDCRDFIRVQGNNATLVEVGSEGSFNLKEAGLGNVPKTVTSNPEGCSVLSINGQRVQGIDGQSDASVARLARETFVLGKITDEELAALLGEENASNSDDFNCEGTESGPLGWILCPIIDMSAEFTEFVFEKFVQPFLEDVPVSSRPDDPVFNAWNSFRWIGNAVLVATMLGVVYAQVRGDR